VEFEWDPQKAAVNVQNHGASFEDAASVFGERFARDDSGP
jgi:uncharacterized DUF497 family protein